MPAVALFLITFVMAASQAFAATKYDKAWINKCIADNKDEGVRQEGRLEISFNDRERARGSTRPFAVQRNVRTAALLTC